MQRRPVGKVRALLKYIFRTVSTLQLMISSVLVCLQPKSMNHRGHASSEEMTIQSG